MTIDLRITKAVFMFALSEAIKDRESLAGAYLKEDPWHDKFLAEAESFIELVRKYKDRPVTLQTLKSEGQIIWYVFRYARQQQLHNGDPRGPAYTKTFEKFLIWIFGSCVSVVEHEMSKMETINLLSSDGIERAISSAKEW